MYVEAIRKIFEMKKPYKYQAELFEMAEKCGYVLALHNGQVYHKQANEEWLPTSLAIDDFKTFGHRY